jgi:predicted O-methyltransferase YrrM
MLLSKNKKLRQLALVAQTANFVSLKALVKNPIQGRALFGEFYRTYADLCGAGAAWPVKSIFEAFPEAENTSITLEHKAGEGIKADVKELVFMAIMTRLLAPRRIFEIGTFRGRTALNFALNSPPECEVFTLDIPLENKSAIVHKADQFVSSVVTGDVGSYFKGHAVSGKIQQLWGDSTRFDYTPYAGKMDLVFVDGAHHYEAVVSDTQNAIKLLTPSGPAAIIWHDFSNFGDFFDVTRAILDCPVGPEVFQLEDTQLAVYWRSK